MNKDRQKINEMSELKIKITASEKVLKLRNKEAVVPFATPKLSLDVATPQIHATFIHSSMFISVHS